MNPPLTDEQVDAALDALTRPMFNWRMARANAQRGSDVALANARNEIRAILQDPRGEPPRVLERTIARARLEASRVRAGDRFTTEDGLRIRVTRVARDATWADIAVRSQDGAGWRKRQPLTPEGKLPYEVIRDEGGGLPAPTAGWIDECPA